MSVRDLLQRQTLVVGLLIMAAGLITASDALHDGIEQTIVWTEAIISEAPYLGMLMFVLLSMISAMVAFFSSALLAPVAIYAWGEAGTFALLWLGWFLGGIASYCIGRFMGRGVAAMIIGEDKMAGWQRQFSERTRFVHVLGFQAVVPSEIPGYVLGTLRYRFIRYAAALAITELPYSLAVVYLGESFLRGEAAVFVLLGVGTLVLSMFVVKIFKLLQRSRR